MPFDKPSSDTGATLDQPVAATNNSKKKPKKRRSKNKNSPPKGEILDKDHEVSPVVEVPLNQGAPSSLQLPALTPLFLPQKPRQPFAFRNPVVAAPDTAAPDTAAPDTAAPDTAAPAINNKRKRRAAASHSRTLSLWMVASISVFLVFGVFVLWVLFTPPSPHPATVQPSDRNALASPAAQRLVVEAAWKLQEGEFQEAAALLEKSVAEHPSLRDAYVLSHATDRQGFSASKAANMAMDAVKSGNATECDYSIATAVDKVHFSEIMSEGIAKFPISSLLRRQAASAAIDRGDTKEALDHLVVVAAFANDRTASLVAECQAAALIALKEENPLTPISDFSGMPVQDIFAYAARCNAAGEWDSGREAMVAARHLVGDFIYSSVAIFPCFAGIR